MIYKHSTRYSLLAFALWVAAGAAGFGQGAEGDPASTGTMPTTVGAPPKAAPAPKATTNVVPRPAARAEATPTSAPEVLYEAPSPSAITRSSGGPAEETAEELPTTLPESPTLTYITKAVPIETVLDKIRQLTGVRVTAMGETKGKPTELVAKDKTVEDVLNMIIAGKDWRWIKRTDGSYEIYDQKSYVNTIEKNQVQRKPFQLKFINAEELAKIIEPILTPEVGSVSADVRANKLIVTDLPDKLGQIQSIVEEYDTQLYTRVFELSNAKTEDVAERFDQIKSDAAEIQVDPVNHMIIVKDTFEKLKAMEQLVELLDRDQEVCVYNLNNIGIDGDVATEIVDSIIKPFATDSETAVLEFNKNTGKLFVKDVRSVHEKIRQILEKMDQPMKQVLIEGELVSVTMDHSFSLGTEWGAYKDMPSVMETLGQSSGDDSTAADSIAGFIPSDYRTAEGLEQIKKGLPMVTSGSSGLHVLELTKYVRAELTSALSDSRTRLLLRPRLQLVNQQQGTIDVTRNEPIVQTYYNTSGTTSYQTSGQQYIKTGLTLDITPTISNRGLVELQLTLTNSTGDIIADIGNGNRGVATNEQSADTFLTIPSGETRVIGGLISRNQSEGESGIPYLAKIPYLGYLFGQKTDSSNLRNLLFFVTPTIIEEQPLNDVVVEPVNDLAKIAMQEEKDKGRPGEDKLTKIPQELVPYLEKIRPEPIPMPAEGEGPTTATLRVMDETATHTAPSVEVPPMSTHPTTGTLSPSQAAPTSGTLTSDAQATGRSLLTNAPYEKAKEGMGDIVATSAVVGAQTGATGPSGVFGGGSGGGGKAGAKGKASSAGATGSKTVTKGAIPAGSAAAQAAAQKSGAKAAGSKTASTKKATAKPISTKTETVQ